MFSGHHTHMKADSHNHSPEEFELEAKRNQLLDLQTKLSLLELELATIDAELQSFNFRYLTRVGSRMARLDELRAQIAEILFKEQPDKDELKAIYEDARKQANSTAETINAAERGESTHRRFAATEELKRLYRLTAQAVHPDLAIDESDRLERTKWMTEANIAYRNGDESQLHHILDEWQNRPEAVKGNDIASQLVRTIRTLASVSKRIETIEKEIAKLRASELYQLKCQTDSANDEGIDMLAEICTLVDEQITLEQARLDHLLNKSVRRQSHH